MSLTVKYLGLALATLGLTILKPVFAEAPMGAGTAFAYSLLAPGDNGKPLVFARVVLEAPDAHCPVLIGSDGSQVSTQLRPLNIKGAQALDAAVFPVTVCEAVIQTGITYTEATLGIALNSVTLEAEHVQVYGDSGCKIKDCGLSGPSTQFKTLTDAGAQQAADLILHMGDYNYRGTSAHFADKYIDGKKHKIYAYDAGDTPTPEPSCSYYDTYYSQNADNSPKPDNWNTWKADFFSSAGALLPKAPWVFTRGNHELCSRAGPGWFYFLGPGSALPGSGLAQMQCPDQGDFKQPPPSAENHITVIPSYRLTLDRINLWVTDSANACDEFSGNPLTQEYQTHYSRLANATNGDDTPTWVIGHRPIWGHQNGGDMNYMQQVAIRNTPTQALPTSVTLSLAGHMHIYESLTFLDDNNQPSGRPPQIVIGTSGVALSGAPGSGELNCLDGERAVYNSQNSQYGYLQMSLTQSGQWKGDLKNSLGGDIANCDSASPQQGKPICVLSTE